MNNNAEQLDLLNEGRLSADVERCISFRNRNAECHRCADVCIAGCINYKSGAFIIKPERCVGCGTCATICPTSAIEIEDPDDKSLYLSTVNNFQNQKEAIFECSRGDNFATRSSGLEAIRVKCLGRVDECLLLSLAATGFETITLKHGDCDNCAFCDGGELSKIVCETANTLLKAWGSRASCRRETVLQESKTSKQDPDKTSPMSLASSSRDEREIKHAHVGKDGTLQHKVPDRRERLLSALDELGNPIEDTVDVRLFGDISIDEEICISCRMCAVFCPTAAITKLGEDDDEEFGVMHSVDACVKCRCCEQICHVDALRVLDHVKTEDISKGTKKIFHMKPRNIKLNDPHQMMHKMRERLGVEEVYER